MQIGGKYNWKGQQERLIYTGLALGGHWHQFEKVDAPGYVWCEVLDADLHLLEETKVPENCKCATPALDSAIRQTKREALLEAAESFTCKTYGLMPHDLRNMADELK